MAYTSKNELTHGLGYGVAFTDPTGSKAGIPIAGLRAIETETLHDEDITILDLRFVKPIDKDCLIELSKKYSDWYVFSDSQKQGGVSSAILEVLNEENIQNIKIISYEYDDFFIEHGDTKQVEESLELLPQQLALKIK